MVTRQLFNDCLNGCRIGVAWMNDVTHPRARAHAHNRESTVQYRIRPHGHMTQIGYCDWISYPHCGILYNYGLLLRSLVSFMDLKEE